MSDIPKKLRRAFRAASVGHVCIDVQKHYCDPALASNIWTDAATLKNCAALADNVHDFAANMRGAAVKHFWVAHTPLPLRRLFPKESPAQIALRELYKEHIGPDDAVVSKMRNDAFWRTRFKHSLKARGVDTLLLTGLYLDQCVEETAKSALKRGFNVAVVEDLTYCLPRLRDETLRKLEKRGAMIVTSADMVRLARS